MKRIRIGKDISMRWEITTDGAAIPLEGRDLTVEIKSPIGIVSNIPFRVDGNTLIMTYYGTEQKRVGEYSVTLWENKGKTGQNVVDVIRAFELVRTSQEEDDFVGGDLQIESVDLGTENFDILTEGGYRGINIDTLQAEALKDSVNIKGKTYSNESFTITLPKANLDSAGVMSADDKRALQEHGNRIAQINTTLDEHTESINAKITTDRIEDGAVTSEKIATIAFDDTLSVSGKIAPANVVGEKLTEIIGGDIVISRTALSKNLRQTLEEISVPKGAKVVVKLITNASTSKDLRFSLSDGVNNYPGHVAHVIGIGNETELTNNTGVDVNYIAFYNEGTDGYCAWSVNIIVKEEHTGEIRNIHNDIQELRENNEIFEGQISVISEQVQNINNEIIGGEREIYNSDFGHDQRNITTPVDIPNGAKFIVKLLSNASTDKNLRFAFSDGTQNYPGKVWHVTGIGSEVEVVNDLGFDVHYVAFYNEGTDGYLAWNTNIRITIFQDGKLTQLTKEVDIIKNGLSKPKIAISYSGTTSSPAMFCNITKSNSVKLEGTGSKTITASIASAVTARCMSIGFKIPYPTQDVAQVSIDGCVFTKAKADSRTASGKAYFVEGDHFHRLNFKANNLESFNITVTADDNVSWEIYLSTEAVLNDDMPLIPITIGYDLAYNYQATFPYEGENISIYKLHKILNIPYYVAFAPDTLFHNTEVDEAIASGLAEVVYYTGGPSTVPEWKKTDGSLSDTYRLAKNAVGSSCNFAATSQHVMDRNIFVNLKNAGFEVIRQYFGDKARFGRLSQEYSDGDVFYVSCVGMGMVWPVWDKPFNLPMVYYGHGIGTPTNPDDPYKSNYEDPTGSQTIDFMTNVASLISQGKIAAMKPSEWLAYCKNTD